jgi:hypothetical protein
MAPASPAVLVRFAEDQVNISNADDNSVAANDDSTPLNNTESYYEVLPFDLEDRGITIEEMQKIHDDSGPPITWKDVDKAQMARATIGVGVDEAWTQAKKELSFIRCNLKRVTESAKPKVDDIFELIFGEDGDLSRVFQEHKIFESHDEYLQFLSTFFLSSAYQVSCRQLFDKHSRIDMAGAMGKDDYIRIWRKLGNANLPSSDRRNRIITPTGLVPLWMKVESRINTYCRELFLKDFPAHMQLTLDDDKPHVQSTEYTAGLKPMRHTKDNVVGHTLHTMVLSYSQTPVQIAWERELNDSSEAATERIFSNGITPMAAPGQPGDLCHVAVAMDRGYWSKGILYNYFMRSGANIKAGTVKRQHCIPMTFAQKLTEKDTREDIPKTGPKTLFTKEAVSYGRKLYCHAYRDGHGGLTLGISTVHGSVPEWELALKTPQHLQWYERLEDLTTEQKLNKSFRQIKLNFEDGRVYENAYQDLADELVMELELLDIRALTTGQGSPEWFLLRRFSLTSSTTDKAISACKGTEPWLRHKRSWEKLKAVLSKV